MRRKIATTVCILVLFLAVLGNLGIRNSKDKNFRLREYFPTIKMTKEFSGGYENAGFSHTVDRVENDKIQIKQWDTGTGVVLVYKVTENDIRLIYSKEGDMLLENYIEDIEPNRDEIILKSPLKVGTKWIDDRGGSYEITGVNVRVFTRIGMFYAMEVTTYKNSRLQFKSYYVKNLGLVKRKIKGYKDASLIKLKYNQD